LREAIVGWLGRRYPGLTGQVDPDTQVLPLNGSREGLFSAIFPALARRPEVERPVVLIPNPFYRLQRAPVYQNFKFGTEESTARMGEVRKYVTGAGAEKDAHALVDFISGLKQFGGKIGTVGYCMGGGLAMRRAAAEPSKVQAAASFHGSQLASDAPDSPQALAPKIKAQLYFGFAIEDRSMPPEAQEKLKAALDAAGVKYEAETYWGARHGWCVKDHTVYHEHQAEHAWQHLVEFFKSTLLEKPRIASSE